jgi:hypothetical protein
MGKFSLVSICGLLLATAACGSSSTGSNDPGGGEIRGQEDVQRFFTALMPDLVAVLTELANDPSLVPSALSSKTDKANGTSTVQCTDGGSISVDTTTGQATATDCSVRGITFSAALALFIESTPPSHQATFNGILMVSGSFTGTVEVNQASIQWTDPATDANTFWHVTVTVNDLIHIASSGDSGNRLDCPAIDGRGSVARNERCDDDGDCQSNSCRDPARNPSEGCTCGGSGGGSDDCSVCVGVNAGPDNDPNAATQCQGPVDFACTCMTQSGETVTLYLSGAGCQ